MKRILLISILILISVNVFSQRKRQDIKWFSIAPKAGIGNSVLLNTDIFNDKNVSPNILTLGYSYGAKLTFSYGNYHHFGLEYMQSSFGQEYQVVTDDFKYDKTVNMKSTDIIPHYRYMGPEGGFVEVGGKFSTFKSIDCTNEGVNLARYEGDISEYYTPKFKSAIFGFGLAVQLHERVHLSGGFRFAYSFTDIVPSKTFNIVDDFIYKPDYISEAATNPLSAQFLMEINYFFAFWGDASCGRGRVMFFQ